jgi:hypothetical protein
VLKTLTYASSTTPVDLGVSLNQFFANADPDNCKPDVCKLMAGGCEAQYEGELILSKDQTLSALQNVGDGQDESVCVMCISSGTTLFFDEVKFSQSRCVAAKDGTCPAFLPENYRKNFKFMVSQTPQFDGLNKTLLAQWQQEGVFDFQEHMNDGDYQFNESLKLVNLTTATGHYVGQNNSAGGLGRLTTAQAIVEGAFTDQKPNGYGRIVDKDGVYYG